MTVNETSARQSMGGSGNTGANGRQVLRRTAVGVLIATVAVFITALLIVGFGPGGLSPEFLFAGALVFLVVPFGLLASLALFVVSLFVRP